MKKTKRPLVIIALCLIGAGLLTCTGVMAVLGFDFSKLDNSVYIENTYEFSQKITDIVIDIKTTDVKILPSSDENTKVICYEDTDDKHIASVENHTLTITKAKREWYEYLKLGFNFHTPDLTIYLPQSTYDSIRIDNSTGDTFMDSINAKNLEIECSTGDITLSNFEVFDLNLETSTGDIQLNNITAHNMEAEVSTGDVDINYTVCSGTMDIESSTGDITFNYSDADTITAETSTGDIIGTLLTAKTFYTETSTGDIDVPRTTGGRCELETSTGNIRINIAE